MLKLGLFERNTNDEAHPKDQRFMKIVKGIGHREDGHCDIPLPLTDPNVELLNSRDGLPSTQALKKKICFGCKVWKQPSQLHEYCHLQ